MKTIFSLRLLWVVFVIWMILFSLLYFASLCKGQPQYIVTDLGTLGGNTSSAQDINNKGQVVGYSRVAAGSNDHAFLYSNGVMTDIGPFGSETSRAYGINDIGQVVVDSGRRGYRTAPNSPVDPVVDYLGTLYAPYNDGSSASCINNSGQVGGTSINVDDFGARSYHRAYRTVSNSSINPATDDLGVSNCYVYGVNDIGQVVVTSDYRGYRTASNSPVNLLTDDIGDLGGEFAHAYGINNSGQVVGYSKLGGGATNYHAFRTVSNCHINPATDDLGTLGETNSTALGINNKGWVVGYSGSSGNTSRRAFLYRDSGPMQDLNGLIPAQSGWALQEAQAINDRGQIVGNGRNPFGLPRGFLLSPIGNSQAYQVQPPTCTPIQRIAKWNDTDWVPVMPNELSSANVHVLVHGWGPGLRQFANDGGKIWDAVDPITGVNVNQGNVDMLADAATAINAKAPNDIVVAFNWLDMSATESPTGDVDLYLKATESRKKTDEAAGALVSALKLAGVSAGVFSGEIQLMGLSHGARVSALTAKQFYNKGNTGSLVVNQLTLGDSPENLFGASGDLRQILREQSPIERLLGINPPIKIGRDSGSTFVDNYYSRFGVSYTNDPDVVNVQLHPDPTKDDGEKHQYPVDWYSRAGNNLALAWSPLFGNSYQTLNSAYEQDSLVNGVFDPAREFILEETGVAVTLSEQTRPLDLSTLLIQGSVTGVPGGMLLTENSPAFWHSAFVTNPGDTALEFTYQFVNPGDGDQLGLWIDDDLRFIITGENAGPNESTTSVDIGGLDPGSHILSVALHNYGNSDASVLVTNFALISSTPEPSSLILFITGAAFLAVFYRRKYAR